MIIDVIFRYIDLWAKDKEIYSKVGFVVSVDESERSIEFEPIEGGNLENVRLQAALDTSSGIVQIPKIGSKVIITFINEVQAFVSLCSEVDKVLIDTDLVQFNGGSEGGLVNINDLVTKFNNLENDVNDLKTAFASWVTVPNDGGAALKAATATWYAAPLTPTNKNDIEDDKIKH